MNKRHGSEQEPYFLELFSANDQTIKDVITAYNDIDKHNKLK